VINRRACAGASTTAPRPGDRAHARPTRARLVQAAYHNRSLCLSRPGGNVTGIFVRQLELAAKRVEIAREAFPRATVVGIAFDTVSHEQRDAAAEAARKLGLEPRMIEVKGQQDYGGAFDAMDDSRGQTRQVYAASYRTD
jgi:hypothetical protein